MPEQEARVNLYLLGPPRLQHEDKEISLPYQKAEALLAYLAVTSRRHSREQLATLFWENSDETRARNNLRTALCALRKNLPPDVLLTEQQFVAIRSEAVWTDVAHLRSVTKTDHPELDQIQRALELWRGPFLDGLSIPDTPVFHDWVSWERQRLDRSHQDGWLALSQLHLNRENLEAARQAVEVLIQLDPLSEKSHRYLIRIHLMSGDRALALQHYEELRQTLRDELGVDPDPATQALHHRALNLHNFSETAEDIGEIPCGVMPTGLTFVGRQHELQTLLCQWRSVMPVGPARMIVVKGEVGVGKTRLITEWMRRVKKGFCPCARCLEAETSISYYAWSELLQSANQKKPLASLGLDEVWLGELAQLLPELRSRQPALPSFSHDDTDLARGRLIQAVYQWLLALTEAKPVCLFIDDLQWIDQASLLLLEYILLNGSEMPLLILGAQRLGETNANWERVKVNLKRAGLLQEVHLKRFSYEEVSALIAALEWSMTDSTAFLKRIYEETEGNPLFVVELVRALQREDVRKSDEWPLPSTIQGVIRAHLSRLSTQARKVMALASIVERKITPRFLELASQVPIEQILSALDQALELTIIVEHMGGKYEFSHDKIRSVLYNDLSQGRREYFHRQVAQAIVQQAKDETAVDFGLVSHHYESGGDFTSALHYALRAARRAFEMYADQDAITWYNRSWTLWKRCCGDLPASMVRQLTPFGLLDVDEAQPLDVLGLILRQRGLVYQRTGRYQLAEEDFQEALKRAEERDRLDEQAVAHDLLSFLAYLRSDFAQLEEHAQQTLELGNKAGFQHLRAAGLQNLGLAAYNQNDLPKTIDLYRQALDGYSAAGARVALADCLNDLGFVLRASKQYPEAVSTFEQALQLYDQIGQLEGQAAVLSNIGRVYAAQGDFSLALDYLKRAQTLSEKLHSNWIEIKIWRTMGRVLVQSQRWEEALEAVLRAHDLAEILGNVEYLGAIYRLLGEIAVAYPECSLEDPADYFKKSIAWLRQAGEKQELERALNSYAAYKNL